MHVRMAAVVCTGLLMAGCSAGPTPTASTTQAAPPPAETSGQLTGISAASGCRVPASLRGKDLERLPVTAKLIALTFDAGANADGVPSIRRTLRDKSVPATFFLTGRFVATYPVKSKRIARGDLVGNHTNTHPDLTTLSDLRVRRQVRLAEQRIRTITGEDPRRFFRFPFGARTPHAIKLLNDLCYVPFRWTVDSLGWKGTSGGMTVRKVRERVMAAASPGAIVLMHVGSNPNDGSTLDAAALPAIIDGLRARGYTLVRLSRIMSPAP